MSLYLLKRGSVYYFRRAIPPELRPVLGRTEFVFSLGTKNIAEAKRRRTAAIAQTDDFLMGGAAKSFSAVAPPPVSERLELSGYQFAKPSRVSMKRQPDFTEWTKLLELWQSDRKAIKKTQDTYLRIARQFFEFRPKSIDLLLKKDISEFKNYLLVDLGKSNGNVFEILKKLRSLLGVAVENDILEYNPAESVRVTVNREKRQPFSHDDLQAIFKSAVFSESLRPTEGRGEAAFWIPVLMALQGLRPRETAQGRVKDVQAHTMFDLEGNQSSWPFFRVTKDAKDGLTVKNQPSERFVPIHPVVVKLGFLDYVQALRDANIYWLFPDITADKYGNKAAKFGEWFNDYLRTTCSIVDDRKVLYSFRHTFKDLTRACGMPDELQRAIMGHAGRGVADSYGSGFGFYRLSEAIKMVRIPGLSILGVPC
jgi:integrase